MLELMYAALIRLFLWLLERHDVLIINVVFNSAGCNKQKHVLHQCGAFG